jgi:hypothetical protein
VQVSGANLPGARGDKCCGLLKGPRAANAVAADGRPRLDGVIGGRRIRAVAGMPEIRDRASAANRLNGQNRSEAVLFPSTDNPPGEDIGKRCATTHYLFATGGRARCRDYPAATEIHLDLSHEEVIKRVSSPSPSRIANARAQLSRQRSVQRCRAAPQRAAKLA